MEVVVGEQRPVVAVGAAPLADEQAEARGLVVALVERLARDPSGHVRYRTIACLQGAFASHPEARAEIVRLLGVSVATIGRYVRCRRETGEVEPQAALDAIAAEWDRLTDEFGRETQLAAYRASVGLPPLEN